MQAFINKESLAYTPKLVGKPVAPPGMSYYGGDQLSVYIPTKRIGSIYIGKNGVKDLYKTERVGHSVGLVPYTAQTDYLGDPLQDGVEAVKLVIETDKPVAMNVKQPVVAASIHPDLYDRYDYEEEVRNFLNLFQEDVTLVKGDPNGAVISLSALENSPKILSTTVVPDLKAELDRSYTEDFLNLISATFGSIDTIMSVEELINNFIQTSTHGSRASKLTWRLALTLNSIVKDESERFTQMLVQYLMFKLLNEQEGIGRMYDHVYFVLPMDSAGVVDFTPFIALQDKDRAEWTLRLNGYNKETRKFYSMRSLATYLSEEEGYTHVSTVDLTPDGVEAILKVLYEHGLTGVNMATLIDLLLTYDTLPTEMDLNEDVLLTEDIKVDRAKRVKIENLMKEVFNKLDKTGLNTKRYQEELFSLSDDLFFKFLKRLVADPRKNLELQVIPAKNEPNLVDIKEALNVLKVPEKEFVYMKHEGDKDNPIRSRYRQTVGYIHVRRLQQILSKKNTYSLSIKQRNMKTNQVTGHDAIARISDLEVSALKAIGSEAVLKELMGPRADSSDTKTELYTQISNFGYAELDTMEGKISNKRTLNTVYQYLTAAGLDSDILVDPNSLINQLGE